jgi:hypothetical protein
VKKPPVLEGGIETPLTYAALCGIETLPYPSAASFHNGCIHVLMYGYRNLCCKHEFCNPTTEYAINGHLFLNTAQQVGGYK